MFLANKCSCIANAKNVSVIVGGGVCTLPTADDWDHIWNVVNLTCQHSCTRTTVGKMIGKWLKNQIKNSNFIMSTFKIPMFFFELKEKNIVWVIDFVALLGNVTHC